MTPIRVPVTQEVFQSQNSNVPNEITAPCCLSTKGVAEKACEAEVTTLNHQIIYITG